MTSFYRALATYEPLIYIALAIGGLFVFRRMYLSWREWRNAVYGLEREFALQRLGQATALGALVLLLLFAEFYVATFVVPSLPALDAVITPTLDLNAAPATLSAEDATQAALFPVTEPVPSGMSGCVAEQIMITEPGSGTEIRGTVVITGTADVPNFGFFKYEFAPAGTTNWATISAGASPVREGELGRWDTTALANGDYFLQLVIIDNVGVTLEPCVIAVRVVNQ
jgi:hypothetical protein